MKNYVSIVMLIPSLVFAQASSFFPRQSRPDISTPRAQEPMISASEAMSIAASQTGGEALSARYVPSGPSGYFMVKVLKEGRVMFVNVSARR